MKKFKVFIMCLVILALGIGVFAVTDTDNFSSSTIGNQWTGTGLNYWYINYGAAYFKTPTTNMYWGPDYLEYQKAGSNINNYSDYTLTFDVVMAPSALQLSNDGVDGGIRIGNKSFYIESHNDGRVYSSDDGWDNIYTYRSYGRWYGGEIYDDTNHRIELVVHRNANGTFDYSYKVVSLDTGSEVYTYTKSNVTGFDFSKISFYCLTGRWTFYDNFSLTYDGFIGPVEMPQNYKTIQKETGMTATWTNPQVYDQLKLYTYKNDNMSDLLLVKTVSGSSTTTNFVISQSMLDSNGNIKTVLKGVVGDKESAPALQSTAYLSKPLNFKYYAISGGAHYQFDYVPGKVYGLKSSSGTVLLSTITTGSFDLVSSGLQASSVQLYEVHKTLGFSGGYSEYATNPTLLTLPQVTGLAITQVGDQYQLTWAALPTATGYTIRTGSTETGLYDLGNYSNIQGTSVTIPIYSTDYNKLKYFSVIANINDPNFPGITKSLPSDVKSIMPVMLLSMTELTLTQQGYDVKGTFLPVNQATGYEVNYGFSSSTMNNTLLLTENQFVIPFGAADLGKTVYAQVRAVFPSSISAGYSSYSAIKNITLKAGNPFGLTTYYVNDKGTALTLSSNYYQSLYNQSIQLVGQFSKKDTLVAFHPILKMTLPSNAYFKFNVKDAKLYSLVGQNMTDVKAQFSVQNVGDSLTVYLEPLSGTGAGYILSSTGELVNGTYKMVLSVSVDFKSTVDVDALSTTYKAWEVPYHLASILGATHLKMNTPIDMLWNTTSHSNSGTIRDVQSESTPTYIELKDKPEIDKYF